MIIQVLLLGAFAAIALTTVRLGGSPRHLALKRLLAVGALGVAGVAVLFPDAVTAVAHLVGVGRGTDLVLYVFVVLSVLVWINTHRRIAAHESRLAQLVRAQALAEAAADRPTDRPTAGAAGGRSDAA